MSMVPVSDVAVLPPDLSIKNLLNIVRRRKVIFIEAFVVVLAAGILTTRLNKPVYQAHAKLLVPVSSSSLSIVDSNNPIGTMLAAAQPDSVETQLNVLQSEPFVAEAERRASIQPKPGVRAPTLKAEVLGNSNILQVTTEGGDPQDVAKLANAVVDLHLERTDMLATTGLRTTTEFVRQEREKAALELRNAADRLVNYRKQHRVVELAAERDARMKEYLDLQAKVGEAEKNVTTSQAQVRELRGMLASEPEKIDQEDFKENPRLAELQVDLRKLKSHRLELLKQFQPSNPDIQSVDDEIADLQKEIDAEPREIRTRTHTPNLAKATLRTKLDELEATGRGYQAEYNASAAKLATHKRFVDDLGPGEAEMSRLTQERDSAQAAYHMLSDRLRDLEIRSHAQMQGARTIARASVPTIPLQPPTASSMAVFVVLALCSGLAMAFVQEYLDDRINSPTDVERFSAMPTLGHIPVMEADRSKLLHELSTRGRVAEAYRALRSSISFAGVDAPVRRLLITSASAGEGKTITSMNLAVAMAMEGKRVIVVDADMRRPSVHKKLDVQASPGLSELLVGLAGMDEVLRESGIENIRILCAGTIPPNPAELVASEAFDRALEDLEQRADLVIFDSPPCVPVTDPILMSARMDGVVIVVHVGQTRKAQLRHCEEMLARARARIVGIVFNQVQPTKSSHYRYYYYGDSYYGETPRQRRRHRRNGKDEPPRLNSGEAIPVGRADDEA